MKILLIEDDPGIQQLLKYGFESKKEEVRSVRDGKEALQRLSKERFDVAVVDLMLPSMGGEDVIRKIREVGSDIILIALTSLRNPEVKAQILQMGADDFVEKPFSFEELYARIRAKDRRMRRGEPTRHLSAGDLDLIPERRIALRNGKEIALSGTEYRLLEFLMQQPGHVFTRQQLMEKVWGYASSVQSNTVDSHIASLRKKLEKGSRKKLIRTVHGLGYLFSAE